MTLEKFIESLANALDLTKHTIKAGTVFFHGTPTPKQCVYLDPDGLAGDKWFTTFQDYAKCYADKSSADPGGVPNAAVFQVTIKEDIFVAKQIEGRDATTCMGRWASAVNAGVLCGYGSSAFAIERKYIRKAIQLRFGNEAADVAGLYKPPTEFGSTDELFLLNCDQRIFNVKRC